MCVYISLEHRATNVGRVYTSAFYIGVFSVGARRIFAPFLILLLLLLLLAPISGTSRMYLRMYSMDVFMGGKKKGGGAFFFFFFFC